MLFQGLSSNLAKSFGLKHSRFCISPTLSLSFSLFLTLSLSLMPSIIRRHLNSQVKEPLRKPDVSSISGRKKISRISPFRPRLSSLRVPDTFKDLEAEFGDLAVLAGIKFHCFHFLNAAAVKRTEREREGDSGAHQMFLGLTPFFGNPFPSSVAAGLSTSSSRSSLPMCLAQRGFASRTLHTCCGV